jgi:hypothetical protein
MAKKPFLDQSVLVTGRTTPGSSTILKSGLSLLKIGTNLVSNTDRTWDTIVGQSNLNTKREIQSFHCCYFSCRKVEIYAPSSQQPPLDTPLAQMDETQADVFNFFNNPANVDKLISYLSLEEKKGRDKFNSKRYILFKVLLELYNFVHILTRKLKF